MTVETNLYPNITFTNVEAFSNNNTIGVDALEQTDRFRIPGMVGNLIAFNIKGNSMYPTIHTGDMVICHLVETYREIKEDNIYAVVTNQSIWVKRVKKYLNHSGKWTHLKLISDNFQEHPPFLVALKDVKQLLKVKHKLTGLG